MPSLKDKEYVKHVGIVDALTLIISFLLKTYSECTDLVHSHPVLESVERLDGNEPPNPTSNTQVQYKSTCRTD